MSAATPSGLQRPLRGKPFDNPMFFIARQACVRSHIEALYSEAGLVRLNQRMAVGVLLACSQRAGGCSR